MLFHTALTKTGSDFIGSLGKSTYSESLSTPEGLPSLGDGLGSKLFEDLVCTAQCRVLGKEVCYWNRCGLKLEDVMNIASQKCKTNPSKTSIVS